MRTRLLPLTSVIGLVALATPSLGQIGAEHVLSTNLDGANDIIPVDLDGDGDLDIVVASYSDHSISSFENLSPGIFGPRVVITTEIRLPQGVRAGDMDGDGDADLVVAGRHQVDSNHIMWLENLGAGNFSGAHIIPAFVYEPRRIRLGDFEGDGLLDIVTVDGHSDAWVIRNLGGSFAAKVPLDSPGVPSQEVQVADLDQDGDLDVLISGNWLRWYENQGFGTFAPYQDIVQGSYDYGLMVDDFNGDSIPDICRASNSGWINYLPGLGGGLFGPKVDIDQSAALLSLGGADAGDLDLDGDPDIVVAHANNGELLWYENLGGTFGPSTVLAGNLDYANKVAIADLDGLGDLEIMATATVGDSAVWFQNDHLIDCNGNGVVDSTDIASGTSTDCNGNGIADECEEDCNGNGVGDACEVASGAALDCNGNGTPDECDIANGTSTDFDGNGIPDDCLTPSLVGLPSYISASLGGAQSLSLNAGASFGFKPYMVLGSFSGVSPGTPVDGLVLPLNMDSYLSYTAASAGLAPVIGGFGILLPGGVGTATFVLPPGLSPSLVGFILNHAYLVLDFQLGKVVFASNPVPVTLGA